MWNPVARAAKATHATRVEAAHGGSMRPIAASLALALLLSAASAHAQSGVRSDWTREGGAHVFLDEDVLGSTAGPLGGQLRVRPPARRVTLIRPRTSWVPEMLKSVEQM
jgi:hypothetical protein